MEALMEPKRWFPFVAVALALVAGAVIGNAVSAVADPTQTGGKFGHVQTSCFALEPTLACAVFDTRTGEIWRYGGSELRPVEYVGRLVDIGRPLDRSRAP
jgi:hypothetical protein